MSVTLIHPRRQAMVAGVPAMARPEPCLIQRVDPKNRTALGVTEDWPTVETTTCRVLTPRSMPQEDSVGGALAAQIRIPVALPPGTDVRPQDRLVVGAHTYQVVAAPEASYEAERVALCDEVT